MNSRRQKGFTIMELIVSLHVTILIFFVLQQVLISVLHMYETHDRRMTLKNAGLQLGHYFRQVSGSSIYICECSEIGLVFLDQKQDSVRIHVADHILYRNFDTLLPDGLVCTFFSISFFTNENEVSRMDAFFNADQNGDNLISQTECVRYYALILDIHILYKDSERQFRYIFPISRILKYRSYSSESTLHLWLGQASRPCGRVPREDRLC